MSFFWYFRYYRRRLRKECADLKDICYYYTTSGTILNGGSSRIVSLTSFPARISYTWIAIESIFRQILLPDRIVLVLSREEFKGVNLPRRLKDQEDRGLEILWVDKNIRSYNKLIPVRERYPSAEIITVDDDIIYDPGMIETLVGAAAECPGTIIGHRGWELGVQNGIIIPYKEWRRAGPDSPEGRVLLTGVGGILYPPGTLNEALLRDRDLACWLCPTADDVYLWAISRVSGARVLCLGNCAIRPLGLLSKTPTLSSHNVEESGNDEQLKNVINYFSLQLS